ncbi:MAG: endonuclease/exonuclease/phosphatase family protein, partial [Silicimonas sp.]|nr:endonuclease/exonuclease/phosphatase family protein [Silicimonas sp.]
MLTALIVILGSLVAVVTVLPLSRSHRWWIRGWDFPRVQIAVVGAVVLLLSAWVGGLFGLAMVIAMLVCTLYQLYRIVPMMPFFPEDIAIGEPRNGDLSLFALNVEMENDKAEDVLATIREQSPDVLFLMEINQDWLDVLEPILKDYQTVLREPKDNYYGLVFATRLKVHECTVEYLTRDNTPSVFARIEDHEGRQFHFVGLHPRPPVPGDDTAERDLQTLYAARFARKMDLPTIVMGDFNDAAWSHTARMFKHVGEYLDVRAGRGMYASFHARYWWFRCPIDQMFITEGIVISFFGMGRYVGSDHFPVMVRIRLDQDEAARLARRRPLLIDAQRKELDAEVAEFRQELMEIH